MIIISAKCFPEMGWKAGKMGWNRKGAAPRCSFYG